MQIIRVINNNVVSCNDDNGQEVVFMGKGVGFQAKPGDVLDEALVERVFRMETQSDTDKLKDLLTSLPPEHIRLCNVVITYAKQVLSVPLNETVYITLADHIGFVFSRIQQGIQVHNGLLSEVRAFYPQEFAVGQYALELLEKELNLPIPEDEAASIALHLVNAEYDASLSQMVRITQVMQDILSIIQKDTALNISKDSPNYDELIIHLKFLVLYVFRNEPNEPLEPGFVHAIRAVYPNEFSCANKVATWLEKFSGYPLSQERRAYLAVNIRRVCRS